MAGLGWTGTSPYGLQSTLRQQVMDRIQQEQQGFNNDIQTRELALREQQAKAQEEDRQQQLAEHAQAVSDAAAGTFAKNAPPVNSSLPPEVAGRLRGTMLGASVQDNPALVQPPASALGGQAMMQPDIQPGSQPGAVWKGTDAQITDQEQKNNEQSLSNDPNTPPAMKQFLRARQALPKGENIPYQVITEPNGPQKPTPRPVPVAGPHGPIYQDPADAVGQQVYEKPDKTPPDHFVAQDRFDEHGTPQAGRMNTLTGEWTPTPGQGSLHAPPGAANAKKLEQQKAESLDALSQLDQAIDAAKDHLGPGWGRVSNIQQLVGDSDAAVQALGTKMLMAKMKVDASIGGMRAAASPQLLSRWDNLLGNKVTPEGLKASVQAMREIVGGAGDAGAHPDLQKFGATYKWDGSKYVKQ